MVKGNLVFGTDRTERWFVTKEQCFCKACSEEIKYGDTNFWVEDKGDLYCSLDCLCGYTHGGSVDVKMFPNVWRPRLSPVHPEANAWKNILSKKRKEVEENDGATD